MSEPEFKTTVDHKYLKIELPQIDAALDASAWSTRTNRWLLEPCDAVIVDFSGVTDFRTAFYRPLVEFCLQARRGGKAIASMNIGEPVAKVLRDQGLWATFHSTVTQAKPSIDPNFTREILGSVVATFLAQAATKCELGESFVTDQSTYEDLDPIAIAAVLNIGVNKFKGTVALGFPKATFLEVYTRMFGERPADLDPEIEDLSAEILNIIYGAAKRVLNESHGYDLKPTLPTVVRGEKISIRPQAGGLPLVTSVWSDAGDFRIEISSNSNI